MTAQDYERSINLEGVINFRDLGGYQTEDGRRFRWRNIFRSGELHHLTQGDVNQLRDELKVATVLDLRNSVEVKRDGTGLVSAVGVKYLNFPLSVGGPEQTHRIRESSSMAELYLYGMKNPWFGPQIVELLGLISEPENHPIVYHCSWGKDRTGILSAILLSLLGIPEEIILADYGLTNLHMEAYWKRVASDPKRAERVGTMPRHLFEAAPEAIKAVLDMLRDEFGTVESYIRASGGDEGLTQRLGDSLLE